jgi:hypothetical protein
MTTKDGSPWNDADAPDTALYIGSLVNELALLAKSRKLDALAYILDMARLEADHISKRWIREAPPDDDD